MKATLLLLVLSALTQAAEIRWTAEGTVDSVTGTGFPTGGVEPGSAVFLEMSYDSGATVDDRNFIAYPLGTWFGEARFIEQIGLRISVRIGQQVWTGLLPATGTSLDVIVTSCWDIGQGTTGHSPDKMTVILNEGSGGTFPSFPYSGGQTDKQLRIDISDSTTPAQLFDIHTLPGTTTDTSHVTSATGSISVGSDLIAFTLAPPTVRVSGPPVPSVITQTVPGVEVSWESELGQKYRIDESDDLSVWHKLSSHTGTGATLTVPLTPFGDHPARRFYQVVEE